MNPIPILVHQLPFESTPSKLVEYSNVLEFVEYLEDLWTKSKRDLALFQETTGRDHIPVPFFEVSANLDCIRVDVTHNLVP